jgi:hypothetical protein
MKPLLVLSLFFLQGSLLAQEFNVHLKDPEYKNGVMTTDQGGVVASDFFRVQAKSIEYIHTKAEHRLTAHGDLMIDNGKTIFVGEKLSYNFKTQTGFIEEGRTQIDYWFVGGQRIELLPGRNLEIKEGFITTSESRPSDWGIVSKKVNLSSEGLLSGSQTTFRIKDTPVFYLPYLKKNLHSEGDTPLKYGVTWDSGQGPKFSMRYNVYSWKTTDLFFRLDYHLKRGFGGALESDSASLDQRTLFQTKSYFAYDTFYNDNKPQKKQKRYRLQGRLESHSEDERQGGLFVYDKYSDRNMPSDFKSDDFELNTAKETRLIFHSRQTNHVFDLNFRPRLNKFEGFKQELPSVLLAFHPTTIGRSGIITDHRFLGAFLNYVSANDVTGAVPNFRALRLSYINNFYRPFHMKGFHLTPSLGFIGIAYNNGPKNQSVGQAILKYGLHLNTTLSHTYSHFRHTITPYMRGMGLTHPTASSNNTYIFSIQDGFHPINIVQFGIENAFYHQSITPLFNLNLYGLAYKYGIPKTQLDLDVNLSSLRFFSNIGYNNTERSFDYTNFGIAYTASSNAAFSFEFRHRGRYDYKKNEHDNYILNVARSTEALVNSPVSDNRNTFLTRIQLKLAPDWSCQFAAHQGWGRKKIKGYNEVKLDLYHVIAGHWKVRVSYMHTVRDDQISGGFSIVH